MQTEAFHLLSPVSPQKCEYKVSVSGFKQHLTCLNYFTVMPLILSYATRTKLTLRMQHMVQELPLG